MARVSGFVQKHRSGVTFTLLVVACVLLILFSNRNVVLKPKQVGQSVTSVFQMAVHSVAGWFAGTWNSIGELKKLRQDLEQTRARLAEYERVSRDVGELRRENEALREQLGFARSLPTRYVAGEVIARDPGSQFSTIMVNRGRRHGVRKGMPVVAFQDGLQGLVGKVQMVNLLSCAVQPISDPTSYVAARLASSRYDGLVAGSRLPSGNLVMTYVRKLALTDIEYGELVVTSGMGQLYPEGIHIGRVREMTAKGYEASLELEVQPIVDFSRLEYVFILDMGQ
ncbi:MAG: rod shape-determining protein MreC [Spirochaetales bacterium]|nr:rod shape-determining protein MreC [Spirochaetales bacterium]